MISSVCLSSSVTGLYIYLFFILPFTLIPLSLIRGDTHHPNLFLNLQEISAIREKLSANDTDAVWCFNELKKHADQILTRQPRPYQEGMAGIRNHEDLKKKLLSPLHNQGRAVRTLGLMTVLTGDQRYAQQAKVYLLAWAESYQSFQVVNTGWDTYTKNDAGLYHVGIIGMCYGYDLIYHALSFSTQERKRIEKFFRAVAKSVMSCHDYWINDFYRHEWRPQNHLTWHVAIVGVIGFLLEDEALIEWALESERNPWDWKEIFRGAFLPSGVQPVEEERDTPIHYAIYNLTAFCVLTEAAYHRGINLWDYRVYQKTVLQSFQHYGRYISGEIPPLKPVTEPADKLKNAAALYTLAHRHFGDAITRSIAERGKRAHESNVFGFTYLTHVLPAVPLSVDTLFPLVPIGFQARRAGESLLLEWGGSAGSDVAGYQILRKESGETDWAPLIYYGQMFAGTVREYLDQNVRHGKTYQYQIVAADHFNNVSAPAMSTPIQCEDKVQPLNPADLNAVASGKTKVYLSWLPSRSGDVMQYCLYHRTEGQSVVVLIQRNFFLDFVHTDLKENSRNEYYVAAVDEAGNESRPSKKVSVKTGSDQFFFRLAMSGDDRYELYLNGQRIAQDRDWERLKVREGKLEKGKNTLAVCASSLGGVAGLIVGLQFDRSPYAVDSLFSDTLWRCRNRFEAGWENQDFVDSVWQTPQTLGFFRNSFWSKEFPKTSLYTDIHNGILDSAHWIWSSEPADSTVYFRRSFYVRED